VSSDLTTSYTQWPSSRRPTHRQARQGDDMAVKPPASPPSPRLSLLLLLLLLCLLQLASYAAFAAYGGGGYELLSPFLYNN